MARIAVALATGATLVLSGCQSLEQIAPPVAAITGTPTGQLSLGREIYITRCTKCHAPEPVRKHSAAEWTVIVADMAEETRLTPSETAAVKDYVMAVLGSTGAWPGSHSLDGD